MQDKKLISEIHRFKKIAGLLKEDMDDLNLSDTPQLSRGGRRSPTKYKIGTVGEFDIYKLPKNDTMSFGAFLTLRDADDSDETRMYVLEFQFNDYIKIDDIYVVKSGDESYFISYKGNHFLPITNYTQYERLNPIYQFIEDRDGRTLPKDYAKKLKIAGLPDVSLYFGKRIVRGGPGVEGTYEELKDQLTPHSRQQVEDVANSLGITWDRMIVYYEIDSSGGSLYTNKLFAILGKDKEGKEYMYDRAGTGAGAYSKVYSIGGTKMPASQAISRTPADFKESDDIDLSDTPEFYTSELEKKIRSKRVASKKILKKLPAVSLQFTDKIKRQGHGVKGAYDQLKSKLTSTSLKNTQAVADKLDITWDEMIIYKRLDNIGELDTLFAILGTDKQGNKYMYDRGGIGPGGYTKLFTAGGKTIQVTKFLRGYQDPWNTESD